MNTSKGAKNTLTTQTPAPVSTTLSNSDISLGKWRVKHLKYMVIIFNPPSPLNRDLPSARHKTPCLGESQNKTLTHIRSNSHNPIIHFKDPVVINHLTEAHSPTSRYISFPLTSDLPNPRKENPHNLAGPQSRLLDVADPDPFLVHSIREPRAVASQSTRTGTHLHP